MTSKTWSILLIFLCWWSNGALFGQSRAQRKMVPDTLFVFDTIRVTDTLKVYKTVPVYALPTTPLRGQSGLSSTGSASFLIISKDFAATFSGNAIIDSTNILHFKNIESMKKMNFFGVMLFAVQHMVLAQNNFSVQLGSGFYQNVASTQVKSNAQPVIMGGLGYSRDFAHDKLRFTTGLEYRFLPPSGFGNVNTIDFRETTFYNKDNFKYQYHMFSVPVAIRWNYKWVSPFIGAEGFYKKSPVISFQSVNSATGELETLSMLYAQPGFGVFGGITIPFSEKIGLEIKYFQGINTENGSSSGGVSYSTYLIRLDAGVRYRLR